VSLAPLLAAPSACTSANGPGGGKHSLGLPNAAKEGRYTNQCALCCQTSCVLDLRRTQLVACCCLSAQRHWLVWKLDLSRGLTFFEQLHDVRYRRPLREVGLYPMPRGISMPRVVPMPPGCS
jgi:hypothetical protein